MCELKEKSKRQKCKCCNVNGSYIDNRICETLLNYEVDGNIFNKYLSEISIQTDDITIKNTIKQYEQQKSEKETEIANLIKALSYNPNEITMAYINQEMSNLSKVIQLLQKEIDSLKITLESNINRHEAADDMIQSFKFFKDNFEHLSVENKRNFIKKCISKIVWDGLDVHIFTKSL